MRACVIRHASLSVFRGHCGTGASAHSLTTVTKQRKLTRRWNWVVMENIGATAVTRLVIGGSGGKCQRQHQLHYHHRCQKYVWVKIAGGISSPVKSKNLSTRDRRWLRRLGGTVAGKSVVLRPTAKQMASLIPRVMLEEMLAKTRRSVG